MGESDCAGVQHRLSQTKQSTPQQYTEKSHALILLCLDFAMFYPSSGALQFSKEELLLCHDVWLPLDNNPPGQRPKSKMEPTHDTNNGLIRVSLVFRPITVDTEHFSKGTLLSSALDLLLICFVLCSFLAAAATWAKVNLLGGCEEVERPRGKHKSTTRPKKARTDFMTGGDLASADEYERVRSRSLGGLACFSDTSD